MKHMVFHAFCRAVVSQIRVIIALSMVIVGFYHRLEAKITALRYEDAVYEQNIRTVLMHPAGAPSVSSQSPAAIPLMGGGPLILHFDEVNTGVENRYTARIIACDAKWRPANINEMEYLDQYNEFHIDDYSFSMATKVPYTHYRLAVPRVTLPCNYLLVVYRNYDEKDLVLSRRFLVFDQKVILKSNVALAGGVDERRENHQIDFTVDYSNIDVPNPLLDLTVVLQQNQRWDNAIFGLQPSMIREDISQLVYRHVNFENNFKAGNEFRFFDMRSIRYSGQNIEKIMRGDHGADAFLYVDQPRGNLAYTHLDDMNGGFFIENTESPDAHLESDYARVHFFLELDVPIDKRIYVAGKLTDWQYTEDNRMEYLPSANLYTCSLLLKQGLYNYCYLVPGAEDDPNMIEGNHFQTNNSYQIIVYYMHPSLRTDIIAGYIML